MTHPPIKNVRGKKCRPDKLFGCSLVMASRISYRYLLGIELGYKGSHWKKTKFSQLTVLVTNSMQATRVNEKAIISTHGKQIWELTNIQTVCMIQHKSLTICWLDNMTMLSACTATHAFAYSSCTDKVLSKDYWKHYSKTYSMNFS